MIKKTKIFLFLAILMPSISNADSLKDYSKELISMKDEPSTYNCMKIIKNIDSININNNIKEKLKNKIKNNLLDIGRMTLLNENISKDININSDTTKINNKIMQNSEIYNKGNNAIFSCNQIYQNLINKKLI